MFEDVTRRRCGQGHRVESQCYPQSSGGHCVCISRVTFGLYSRFISVKIKIYLNLVLTTAI